MSERERETQEEKERERKRVRKTEKGRERERERQTERHKGGEEDGLIDVKDAFSPCTVPRILKRHAL